MLASRGGGEPGAASFILSGRRGLCPKCVNRRLMFDDHIRAPVAAEAPEGKLGPIPLTKSPYAHLAAIDLNLGEIAWKVPFGEGGPEIRTHPLLRGVKLPERLGTAGDSRPLATKGGLIFLGGGEPYLYAFDKETGSELWRGATQFPATANPVIYRTQSGRQFVLVATGGGAEAALVAFALPSQ